MPCIDLLHRALYRWYEQYHRVLPWRETDDPYKIWLSEIILQQTRVVQGMEYYLRFTERFADVEALAAAEEDEVLRYWQGLGYYSRARNLHKAAKMIVAEGWQPFPTDFEQIRQLPGVGDYTAGAIASFAYNMPYPAMDGNVYRVLARLYDCDVAFDTGTGKKHFHRLIEELLDREHARLFNSAIMEFGALYCTPSLSVPDSEESACTGCPLGAFCMANMHHTAALLPVRKPRPELRDRYLNYFIYLSADTCDTDADRRSDTSASTYSTLLHKRTAKDIWQHLYEFPLIEADHLMDAAEAEKAIRAVAGVGCIAEPTMRAVDFTHILSHQRLHARFFCVKTPCLPGIANTIEVALADLDRYALAKLTLRAMEKLGIGHN